MRLQESVTQISIWIAEFILRMSDLLIAPGLSRAHRLKSAMQQTKVFATIRRTLGLVFACFAVYATPGIAALFDAAPFAQPLSEGSGLIWEDPREIHKVTVKFADASPSAGPSLRA